MTPGLAFAICQPYIIQCYDYCHLLLLVLLYVLRTTSLRSPTPLLETRKTLADRLILASGNSGFVHLSHPSTQRWSIRPPVFDLGAYVSSRGPHIDDYAQPILADPPKSMIDAAQNPLLIIHAWLLRLLCKL